MHVRLLTQSDYVIFEAYLKQYAETSMFMRSNALEAGLDFERKSKQAHYFGAFDDAGALSGLMALNWNGNIFMQVNDDSILEQLLTHASAAQPEFIVKGVLAPEWQAKIVRDYLGAPLTAYQMNEVDKVYSLQLDKMVVPVALANGSQYVRPIIADDLDLVTQWCVAYEIEALGRNPDKPGMLEEERADLAEHLGKGDRYVLVDMDDHLLSKASFNAQLPDIVQMAVFTRRLNYAGTVTGVRLLPAFCNWHSGGVLNRPYFLRMFPPLPKLTWELATLRQAITACVF